MASILLFYPTVKGKCHSSVKLRSTLFITDSPEGEYCRRGTGSCPVKKKNSYTDRLASGRVDMYAERSNASYKSPSSSSLASIP